MLVSVKTNRYKTQTIVLVFDTNRLVGNANGCDSNPCQNGVCLDEANGFSCECNPGYEGVQCETREYAAGRTLHIFLLQQIIHLTVVVVVMNENQGMLEGPCYL